MFRVTRQIDFCYGHRLLNYEGKCRYLHGHNGRAVIVIEVAAARPPRHGAGLLRHQARRQRLDRREPRPPHDPAPRRPGDSRRCKSWASRCT